MLNEPSYVKFGRDLAEIDSLLNLAAHGAADLLPFDKFVHIGDILESEILRIVCMQIQNRLRGFAQENSFSVKSAFC